MPTDTIDQPPIDELAAEIDWLLSDLPVATPSPLCSTVDVDALAELLRTALRRVERNTTPDTARFLSDGGWLHSRERQFTRTCNADVRLVIRVEPVSVRGGGWAVLVSDQLLRYVDGSATVFDTPEDAMRAADQVLTETRVTVTIPAVPFGLRSPR